MMPLDDKTFRELCLLRALGQLGPKEEAILIGSLAEADEERLAFFAETAGRSGNGEPDIAPDLPDPAVKAKLVSLLETSDAVRPNRLGTGPRPPTAPPPRPGFGSGPGAIPGSGRSGIRRVFAFAAWVLGAGLIAFSAFQWQRAEKNAADLKRYRARVESLEDSLGVKEALLAVLSSPQVRLASLKSGVDPAATGKVYWDGLGRQGILHVSALPPAPEGQAYYLWILVDDKTDPCINAGSFAVRRLRPEGDFYRFQGDEELSRLKVMGFEVTTESLAEHSHGDGHAHDHLHPTGRTLLKSETFL